MDMNWMHIQIPINLTKPFEHKDALQDQIGAMFKSTQQDHKRFPAIPALLKVTEDTLAKRFQDYQGTLAVLPETTEAQ